MNKLGVIQVIDSLDAGGAEVLAINIANALGNEGVNSHLCTTRKEGVLKSNLNKNIDFLFLGRKKSIDFLAIFRFKKYLKKNNIGIIHAHTTSYFFAFCIKLIYPKVKIIWHNHTGNYVNLKGFKFFVIKFISTFFDGIINVNEELNTWSIKKLKHKNSIKLDNFPQFINKSKTTKLNGKDNKRIVILASLRKVKNHLNLLEAFNSIHIKYPDWTLHFIGKDFNDSYSKKIKQFILQNGLEKSVFLYGLCLDIEYILKQTTIGVLSSNSEGLPVSLLEYGLAKLPVVVTNVGECSKVIENGKSGLIVEKENSNVFAKALEEYILSVDKRCSLGNMHFKNVEKKYSQERFIIQLKNIYTL
ncbi:glycosyltransferase [Polaribacter sp. 11A2H]|uniref:glycosyltransferase n=1 Tax=Polaribacter sp. 11A2H TaxID=2687290 RepID=UPI00140CF024|nr:glycosyltransferase [Polaribacter sp. 11A2H]